MTLLCVAIFVTDPAAAKRDIALAAEAGADMVELRVDHLTDPAIVQQVIRGSSLPCIVTCRPTWEGGNSELPENGRLQLLSAAATAEPAYIDIELKSARQLAPPGNETSSPKLIVSTHDFSGRPDRFYNLIADLNASGGDINKIVWMARSIRDNLEAFDILKTRQKPTIALCMGEAGLISRVLTKKFGGFLTFAALDSSGGTASGQIAVADMKKLYRWDQIGPATKVYGVVGSPVMHSMSPAIHNAAFDAVGHDGVYLPLLVEPGYESFKAFMETFLNFDGLNLSGLSVTIPHKENCLRYLKEKGAEIEPLAEAIGAVNTVVVGAAGVGAASAAGTPPHAISPAAKAAPTSLRGFNTDYAAILDSITAALGITRDDLAGRRIAVIGAGGTGRTAVAGLAHCGAIVTVCNRTVERADALAAEFNGRRGQVTAAALDQLHDASCEILINTTSVGMHPKVHDSPLGDHSPGLAPGMLVFDTVYNPMKTKLLAQAEQAGCKTVSGVEMFVRQAVGQFEAWTGRTAPRDIMRRVIERRLTPAHD